MQGRIRCSGNAGGRLEEGAENAVKRPVTRCTCTIPALRQHGRLRRNVGTDRIDSAGSHHMYGAAGMVKGVEQRSPRGRSCKTPGAAHSHHRRTHDPAIHFGPYGSTGCRSHPYRGEAQRNGSLLMSLLDCASWPAAAVVLASIGLAAAAAPASAASPFAGLSGSWSGGGQIRLENGRSESIRCSAHYAPRGGAALGLALRCASASNRIELPREPGLKG